MKEWPPIYLFEGSIFGNANRKKINDFSATTGRIHLFFVPKSGLCSTQPIELVLGSGLPLLSMFLSVLQLLQNPGVHIYNVFELDQMISKPHYALTLYILSMLGALLPAKTDMSLGL